MGYITLRAISGLRPGGVARLPVGKVLAALSDDTVSTTRSADGIVAVAAGYTLLATLDGGGTAWGQIAVVGRESLTPDECERLNRLTRGTGFPRFETNWRTKSVCMNVPGNRVPMPVEVKVDLDLTGKAIGSTLEWRSLPKAAVVAPMVVTASASLSPTAVGAITAPDPGMGHGTGAHPSSPPPSVATVGVAMARAALSPLPTPPVSAAPGTARAALTGSVFDGPAAGRAPVDPHRRPAVAKPLTAEALEPVADPSGVFTWPTHSSGIITPKGTESDLDKIWEMHMAGDRQVISLIGPAGVGKTSLAYDLAVRNSVPIAKIDGAGAVTFADWVGSVGASEQNGATVTAYRPSGFIQACRADGPMAGIPRIILLDEVNRSESSAANNALIPVLDHTGSLYVADYGRSIPLDPAVMYVMTANMGGEFTGTVSLDQALVDRVTHWVDMVYPARAVEVRLVQDRTGLDLARSETLVDTADQIRQIAARGEIVSGIGPRRVLMAARKLVKGFSGRSACHSTWSLAYSNEGGATSERNAVRDAINSHFTS